MLPNHTHCQVTQSKHANQNLPKNMVAQRTAVNRKELHRNEKHENLTKCIVNALSSYFQL